MRLAGHVAGLGLTERIYSVRTFTQNNFARSPAGWYHDLQRLLGVAAGQSAPATDAN
jgi:hypothetical protein